ncbi:LCP family protein [Geodermatophilus sp. Leaf369]|uniref:LCP family protein n=1 Tax=Geodermatophilus sp. Leaf369 TaxID=1736354 RepID=UPI001F2F2325|nr:LCP family protein [Geodermatophilus sp. Leaf369]
MADQPRRDDGPGDGHPDPTSPTDPSTPRGGRASRRGGRAADAALTVEALLARSREAQDTGGRAAGRRRADRRPVDPQPPVTSELPAQAATPPVAPPVPPPTPPAARPSAPVPPLPGTPRAAAQGDGVRLSTPVPPLPGTARAGAPVPPIPGRDVPIVQRPPTRAERRAAMSPLRRRLVRAVVVLAVLLGLVGSYYVGLYFYVDRSVQRVAALATDAPEVLAPQLQAGAQTYLVVGTDLPGQTGPASVTTLIAHVPAEGGRAVLVTVPPTALVDTPECRTAEGGRREPTSESFADALLDGGPSCLVRAVQQLSGLRVDHYLGVDLGGLPGMVDAVGGISVCLAAPLPAGSAAVTLDAGTSELDGDQVAGVLRPGSSGSDVTGTEVAEREQLLLTSTLREALSPGSLVDPIGTTSFLTRAADAFTVDDGTTLGDVRALASTLREVSGDAVERTTLPVERVGYVPTGGTAAHVLLDGDATRSLFDAVIRTGALPAPTEPATAETAPVAAPATVSVAPADVTVDVLDATGTRGDDGATGEVATSTASALAAQGFRTGTVGTESGAVSQTLVRFGPDAAAQASTVAAAVPGSVLQPSDAVGGAVQLVVASPDVAVQPVTVGAALPESAVPTATPTPEATATCG